ncbi:RibD family protein [Methanofollis aquaemaris]|uniref:RibD family protein n=1 Tax=Methanofollis aquaemaris TaxID=126734 RepID=A0A8A3S4E2_9EURY|nr:dihydrofolate reductase family protein [Methanofollis aquaemaris]QSZ66783.1 RibD family protein [Methanofollis aquaemaris]
MLLDVIIHTSMSIDGAVTGFLPDIGLHYEVAAEFTPDAMLVGSMTAVSGVERYLEEVPPEEVGDLERPAVHAGDTRPLWVFVDSRGKLHGLLHVYRRSEYCRDIVVLVAEETPAAYLEYLSARDYPIIRAGGERVDLRTALEALHNRFGVQIVVSDSGERLNSALLEAGLVKTLSLVLTPTLAGRGAKHLFESLDEKRENFVLERFGEVGDGCVHLVYRVG